MDLGEVLFKRFAVWLKKRKEDSENSETVFLADIKPRLTLIARALTQAPIDILPAISEGGRKGTNFYLPEKINFYPNIESNLKFYLFRIFFLSKQFDLNHMAVANLSEEEARASSLSKAGEVLDALALEFPNIVALHKLLQNEEIESHWFFGKLMQPDVSLGKNELSNVSDLTSNSQDITTEIKSKPVEDVTSIQVDKERQEEFTLQHNFEKVETAEEFDEIWRDFDGDDNLEDDLNAINDLNLKHTVRVDDVVHSIYKADFAGQLTIAETKDLKQEGFYYSYPEWNYGKRLYKRDFCRVYPLLFRSAKSNYFQDTISTNRRSITTLKKNLAQFYNSYSQVRKVNQGQEFDLDQVIDMFVNMQSRITPDENIYVSRRKRKKDLSILFLIDLSLSGDGYILNRRIIDIEKQAVIILGEVLSAYDISFQIDGFFSKTRNFCSYVTLKHFKDRWKRARSNIGNIQPQGFTRIGPALRHAGFLLSKNDAKNKWVILLSDGKPNDYDRYEGKYGVEDIKMAIRELNDKNVQSYAIAIEDEAKYYLPQMFGINHYSILSHPDQLPGSVLKLYQKIASG